MNLHATTIIGVKKKGMTALAGDGQVTLGNTIMKGNANKLRRLYNGQIVTGFAGAVADAFTLYDRFEKKLQEFNGDLLRSCVELASMWRMDKYLRQLQAMLLVADRENMFLLSGTGEVIEPADDVIAIGSGGDYARSAALAYMENSKLTAEEIAKKSLKIAGKICIYTNDSIACEVIEGKNTTKKKNT